MHSTKNNQRLKKDQVILNNHMTFQPKKKKKKNNHIFLAIMIQNICVQDIKVSILIY